jgi:TPR repeat protein
LGQEFKLSADQSHESAQWKYAEMLYTGDGIEMNKSFAAHYLKLCADQGHAHAQLNFGLMLSRGDGPVVNKPHAAYYWKLAADQGDSAAQFEYGRVLFDGDGVVVNKGVAAEYLKLSADQGYAPAQWKYAVMLHHGFRILMLSTATDSVVWSEQLPCKVAGCLETCFTGFFSAVLTVHSKVYCPGCKPTFWRSCFPLALILLCVASSWLPPGISCAVALHIVQV